MMIKQKDNVIDCHVNYARTKIIIQSIIQSRHMIDSHMVGSHIIDIILITKSLALLSKCYNNNTITYKTVIIIIITNEYHYQCYILAPTRVY